MDRRFRWIAALTAVFGAVAVGVLSYNAGVSHGLAIGPALANAPNPQAVPYGWYRPWGFGFGFGFFPFFPFLFILFWFFIIRALFWRGAWGYRGGWEHRRWDTGGVPPAFEEWHRRAHAQQGTPPTPTNL